MVLWKTNRKRTVEFPDRSTSPPHLVGQLIALDDFAVAAAESVVKPFAGSDVLRDVAFAAAVGWLGDRAVSSKDRILTHRLRWYQPQRRAGDWPSLRQMSASLRCSIETTI